MKKIIWFVLIAGALILLVGKSGNLVAAWNAGIRDRAKSALVQVTDPVTTSAASIPQMPQIQMPVFSIPAIDAGSTGTSQSSAGAGNDWDGRFTISGGFVWDNLAISRQAQADLMAKWGNAMQQAWDAEAVAYAAAYTAATSDLTRAMKEKIMGEMMTEWARQGYYQTVYRTQTQFYPVDYSAQMHNRWARDIGWTIVQYVLVLVTVAFAVVMFRREWIKGTRLKTAPNAVIEGDWTMFFQDGNRVEARQNRRGDHWRQFREMLRPKKKEEVVRP